MKNSVGDTLRATRQERGLSIEQASSVTRVRVAYLKALEENEADNLPSKVQARGYLRLYADYLGLPVQPLLDAWPDREPILPGETLTKEAEEFDTTSDVPENGLEEKFESPHTESDEHLQDQDSESEPIISEDITGDEKEQVLTGSQSIFVQIGEDLRQRREAISLSLQDVERFTRLRAHYITALENGEVDELPSLVQGRGMLANYAEFLDLDIDEFLMRFADALQARRLEIIEQEKQAQQSKRLGRPRVSRSDSTSAMGWRRFLTPDLLIGGTLFTLFFIFVIWGAARVNDLQADSIEVTPPPISEVLMNTSIANGEITPESTQVTSPTVQVLPGESIEFTTSPENGSPTVPVPALPEAPLQVYVVANQRTWMQIIVDGSVAFEGRTIPGNAYPFTGQTRIELATGNGSALQVVYNQQNLGALGLLGEVVRLIFTPDGMLIPTSIYTSTPTATQIPTSTVQPSPIPATSTVTPLIP